jgi:hypothetical protein
MNPGSFSFRLLSNRSGWPLGSALLLVLALLAVAMSARALVIVPIWDSSITNDPNAATIEASINMAIQFYEARFADPITVTIQYLEMTNGLGESEWTYYTIPYALFRAALQTNATTTNDIEALAYLPAGPNNPVSGDTNINIHVANLKVLGLTSYYGISNEIDGSVYLNTSAMNLARPDANPTNYDLISVAEHEMDEVLAFSSGLNNLTNSGDPFPQDLFRYASDGTRSFTTNGDDAYFSLDGRNLLVQFNQQSDGDYGDWWSNQGATFTPRVQDAFGTPGATPNPNVELIGLDVIGYDLVPAPRPIILNTALSGTNLVLNGTNGLATGVYHLLASTNLAMPLNKWSSVSTNALSANGSFSITATNAVKRNSASQFYVLQLQ